MPKKILWAVLALVIAGGIWKLNAYFSATVDWPLVILNAKNDALTSRENEGNYSQAILGKELSDMLQAKDVSGQVSLTSINNGTEAAVIATGLSARTCEGLQKHPELLKAFDRIDVQDGLCTQNSTIRFWFK